eukprot:364234-Chlamydomonas_euryale.AAC.9
MIAIAPAPCMVARCIPLSFEVSKVVIVAMPCKIQGWTAAVDDVVTDEPIISKNQNPPGGMLRRWILCV